MRASLPRRALAWLALLARTVRDLALLAVVLLALAVPSAGAHARPDMACHVAHCIAATRDHGHVIAPADGIEPACPAGELGWRETFTLAGTRISFAAVCVREARRDVWTELP